MQNRSLVNKEVSYRKIYCMANKVNAVKIDIDAVNKESVDENV